MTNPTGILLAAVSSTTVSASLSTAESTQQSLSASAQFQTFLAQATASTGTTTSTTTGTEAATSEITSQLIVSETELEATSATSAELSALLAAQFFAQSTIPAIAQPIVDDATETTLVNTEATSAITDTTNSLLDSASTLTQATINPALQQELQQSENAPQATQSTTTTNETTQNQQLQDATLARTESDLDRSDRNRLIAGAAIPTQPTQPRTPLEIATQQPRTPSIVPQAPIVADLTRTTLTPDVSQLTTEPALRTPVAPVLPVANLNAVMASPNFDRTPTQSITPNEIAAQTIAPQTSTPIQTLLPAEAVLTSNSVPSAAPNSSPLPIAVAETITVPPGAISTNSPINFSEFVASVESEFRATETADTLQNPNVISLPPDARANITRPQFPGNPAPPANLNSTPLQLAEPFLTHAHLATVNGQTEFQVRLDPPELGRMQVKIFASGDQMRAEVIVADQAVRGLLESQLPELRQKLEAAGLNIQQFDVSAESSASGNGNPQRDEQPGTPWEWFEPAQQNPRTRSQNVRERPTPILGQRIDVTV